MKRILSVSVVLALVFSLGGCMSARKDMIFSKANSERADVYAAVPEGCAPQAEPACLTIRFSIKTHVKDFYLLEPTDSTHGASEYPVVVNIDGQGEIWQVKGQLENTPAYDEKGRIIAEGGEGMRYTLEKHLRMKPGRHQLYLGFPEDGVSKEVPIELGRGEEVWMELKPVYNQKRPKGECFYQGISHFDVSLRR